MEKTILNPILLIGEHKEEMRMLPNGIGSLTIKASEEEEEAEEVEDVEEDEEEDFEEEEGVGEEISDAEEA